MTVVELREFLATIDGGYEIKLSGCAIAMGDGFHVAETQIAPGLQNVTVQDGFAILWPECSWEEALDHAEQRGPGVE